MATVSIIYLRAECGWCVRNGTDVIQGKEEKECKGKNLKRIAHSFLFTRDVNERMFSTNDSRQRVQK